MKVGDKLLCKKDFGDFIKGESYKISSIYSDGQISFIGILQYFEPNFETNINESMETYYLYNYFYTKEECRNKKLKTIL